MTSQHQQRNNNEARRRDSLPGPVCQQSDKHSPKGCAMQQLAGHRGSPWERLKTSSTRRCCGNRMRGWISPGTTMKKAISNCTSVALLVTAALIMTSPALAAEITGIPRIVDGDTIWIGQVKIRLSGLDAPETDQICLDAKGEKWACGVSARDDLIRHSNGQAWECTTTGIDQKDRLLANCFIDGEDVSKWIVRSGWALSYVRYSHAYDADEIVARENRTGLWSGSFIAPWDWRHRNKATMILGAASVPVNAQTILFSAVSASEAPSPECVIKGNVNGKGERIYHQPGQLNYSKINMHKGLGARWFCTEPEAEAAGWRKAIR